GDRRRHRADRRGPVAATETATGRGAAVLVRLRRRAHRRDARLCRGDRPEHGSPWPSAAARGLAPGDERHDDEEPEMSVDLEQALRRALHAGDGVRAPERDLAALAMRGHRRRRITRGGGAAAALLVLAVV